MELKKPKIGTRLTLGLGLVTLFIVLLIVNGISSMRQINHQLDQIVTVNNNMTWYANIIRDSVHRIDKSLLTIISTRDEQTKIFEKIKILTARATYGNALENLEGLEQTQKGKELLSRTKELLAIGKKNNDFSITMALNGQPDKAIDFYMNSQRPHALKLQQIGGELVTYEKEQSDLRYLEAKKIYTKTRTIFLIIGTLAVLSGLLMVIFLTRSITIPLAEGVQIANRLAEGDFTVSIKESGHDEAGRLLLALKNMAERLKQIKSLEQQLLQSQKLENVGRLAGGVAHDFNNLLTVIGGFSDLALRKVNGNESLRKNIVEIQKASNRAANLTRQLLAFSRRQVMEMKIVNLNTLLKDLEKMLSRVISEDVELKIATAQDLGMVKADPGQMEQVILNLVVNAKDAMPSGGHLTIETANCELDETYCRDHVGATPGAYVQLSVSDTGLGIRPEIQDLIFEPFFTTKEQGKGTGLGLSTVYGIVKQSNGHIWVYSEEGFGATFKIYLPYHHERDAPVFLQEEAIPLKQGSGTVLLVEDESIVRSLAALVLREQGYRVLEAADGFEALHLVHEDEVNNFSLLLTDVIMPKMSGKELADKVKSLYPDIKVLFTSGYTTDAIVHHGVLEAGIAFLPKPFTPTSLTRKVQEIFEHQ